MKRIGIFGAHRVVVLLPFLTIGKLLRRYVCRNGLIEMGRVTSSYLSRDLSESRALLTELVRGPNYLIRDDEVILTLASSL